MGFRMPGFRAMVLCGLGVVAMGTTARADVTVINQTNNVLVVSAGCLVNGRLVYGGWTTIQNGGAATVYVGNEPRVILSVHVLGNPQAVKVVNNFGVISY